jgi:hypothetical protein
MSIQYRQGDVLLIKLTEAESEALGLKERGRPAKEQVILAFGEATGHSHSVDGGTAVLHERRAERYLAVWAPAVSADDRSPENTEIGSPPTPSENVPSPTPIGRRDGCWDWRTS